MKSITLFILLGLFANSAFAGTPTFWSNKSLGFEMIESTHTEDIEVCDEDYTCLTFVFDKQVDRVREYTEKNGACKLSQELVNHDHADISKDKNSQSMMSISYQVVRVKEGAEECKLKSSYGKMRPLFGIYMSGNL